MKTDLQANFVQFLLDAGWEKVSESNLLVKMNLPAYEGQYIYIGPGGPLRFGGELAIVHES